MTRQLIEITFGNALTQAAHLDECAAEMTRVALSRLSDVEEEIRGAWEGDSANAYIQKMNMTEQNILATARKLESMASTIRRVAYIFRESELKAIEIAERRDYH